MISRRLALGGGAVALAGAGAALAKTNGVQVVTAVDVHPRDYPTVAAVRRMGDEIARETGGRIAFRQYPSGQLGTETDTVNLARFRAIHAIKQNQHGRRSPPHRLRGADAMPTR